MENLKVTIMGGGTRAQIAQALRLIATAMDGTGEFPQQDIEDMDGAGWNDMALVTEVEAG